MIIRCSKLSLMTLFNKYRSLNRLKSMSFSICVRPPTESFRFHQPSLFFSSLVISQLSLAEVGRHSPHHRLREIQYFWCIFSAGAALLPLLFCAVRSHLSRDLTLVVASVLSVGNAKKWIDQAAAQALGLHTRRHTRRGGVHSSNARPLSFFFSFFLWFVY